MSETVKPTIAALRAWLKTCPLIADEQEATGAAFRIAGLEEESTAFSIEDSPGDPIITEYIYDVIEELGNAFAAEKQRYAAKPAQPMNREQRRAQAKKNRHKPPVSYPAPPAAQMVERVDNAARRKQLLAELAALENG